MTMSSPVPTEWNSSFAADGGRNTDTKLTSEQLLDLLNKTIFAKKTRGPNQDEPTGGGGGGGGGVYSKATSQSTMEP